MSEKEMLAELESLVNVPICTSQQYAWDRNLFWRNMWIDASVTSLRAEVCWALAEAWGAIAVLLEDGEREVAK